MHRSWLCLALVALLIACGDDSSPRPDASIDSGLVPDASIDGRVFGDATLPDSGADAGAACGNGVLEGSEECDDGNLTDGDACSSTCHATEMVINTTTAGDQGAPVDGLAGLDVAATATNFVVTWSDAAGGIRQQLLSRAGAPRTNGFDATKNDFPANRRTAGTHILPRVAPRSADDYVIAWTERGAGAASSSGRVRLFGGDGTPSNTTVDEVDVGATDLSASEITTLATLDTEHVVVWRESAGTLMARAVSSTGAISFPAAAVQISASVGVGADLRLAPVRAGIALGLLDRGTGNHLVRVGVDAALTLSAAMDLGARRPAAVAGSSTALAQAMIVEEGLAPGIDPLLTTTFTSATAASGTAGTIPGHPTAPFVAAHRGGFAVVWVDKGQAGARDTVRLVAFDATGAMKGPFPVSSRAVVAGAADLGVDSPRASVAANGNVLVVWRDFGDRTGAGTAGDTGAELHGRVFQNLLP